MIGMRRRKKVEGWAVDVPEAEAGAGMGGLRQKLADDNRLWLIVFGVVLIFAFWMIMGGRSEGGKKASKAVKELPAYSGYYTDEKHQECANKFMAIKQSSGLALEARFEGQGSFKLVLPNTASQDDIRFMAKMAGLHLRNGLKESPVINVYLREMKDLKDTKVGEASWDQDQSNYVYRSTEKPAP